MLHKAQITLTPYLTQPLLQHLYQRHCVHFRIHEVLRNDLEFRVRGSDTQGRCFDYLKPLACDLHSLLSSSLPLFTTSLCIFFTCLPEPFIQKCLLRLFVCKKHSFAQIEGVCLGRSRRRVRVVAGGQLTLDGIVALGVEC